MNAEAFVTIDQVADPKSNPADTVIDSSFLRPIEILPHSVGKFEYLVQGYGVPVVYSLKNKHCAT